MADEDRLAAIARRLDGIEILLDRSTRTTDRMMRDQEVSKAMFRQWRQQVEEQIDLLERAFGATTETVVNHATDPDAHTPDGAQ